MQVSTRRPGPTNRLKVTEFTSGRIQTREDLLVTEEPLEIRLSAPGDPGRRVAVTMRTPGHDFELAAGFLVSEGIIEHPEHIATITYCLDGTVTEDQMYNVVSASLTAPPLREPAVRHGDVSAACGVCGKQSIDEILPIGIGAVDDTVRVALPTVLALPGRLREQQGVFSRTGGLHAAGIFDPDGTVRIVREDVGRHNAVDKILGARMMGTVDYPDGCVVCVSGRVGFDIVAKVLAGRWPVVVAVGAPSSLAVDLAIEAGITVCGFTRGDRMVCYSHPHRITD